MQPAAARKVLFFGFKVRIRHFPACCANALTSAVAATAVQHSVRLGMVIGHPLAAITLGSTW